MFRLRHARILLYDTAAGGAAVATSLLPHTPLLLQSALDVLQSCTCDAGCPECILCADCREFNACVDKRGATTVLQMLCDVLARENVM